jgi:hypothetical protein
MSSDKPSAAPPRGKGSRDRTDRQRALITPISIDDLTAANAAWHEVDEGYTALRTSLQQEVAALRELIRGNEVLPGQNLEQSAKQFLEAAAEGTPAAEQDSAQTRAEPAPDPQGALAALRSARREIQSALDIGDKGERMLADAQEQANRAIEHAREVKVARRAIAVLVIVLFFALADEIMLLGDEIMMMF